MDVSSSLEVSMKARIQKRIEETIFFPTPTREKEDGSAEEYINDKLKPGIRFRATMYNLAVEGMVTGVYPTQMHGCTAEIKGTDV